MTVVAIVLLVLAGLALAGALLVDEYLHRERTRRAARDARIDAMWRTMHASQRIHLAFWIARRRMEQEAERLRDEEYRS